MLLAAATQVAKWTSAAAHELEGTRVRAQYMRDTRALIDSLMIAAVGLQMTLSASLAPRGSKSRSINAVWLLAAALLLGGVRLADSLESRGMWVGSIGACLLSLTRVQRAVQLARGTPSDARAFLKLGHGVLGSLRKTLPSTFSAGVLLTLLSTGAPSMVQLLHVMAPEAARVAILLQAALRGRDVATTDGRSELQSAML